MAAAAADVQQTAQATPPQAATPPAPAAAAVTPTTPPAAAPVEWFYADGVKGTGDRPEFFRHDKYKNLGEQARAYVEAEKKIGELTTQLKAATPATAPAEYKLPDLAELGGDMEWNKNDPLLGKAFEVAKAHKLPQEVFTALAKDVIVPLIRNYELLDIGQEKTLMGERADERLNTVTDWAKRNLNEEQFAVVNAALGKWSRPHEVFKAFEAILSATRQPSAGKLTDDVRTGTMTKQEWDAKWYAKSEVKGLTYKIDEPGNRDKARAELAAIVGSGDHIEIVGKR